MVVIIDYKMGNVGSIANMCKKIGEKVCISADKDVVENADKLILPGVGAFDEGMRQLDESGTRLLLEKMVIEKKIPLLGICLGMQLLTRRSDEGRLPGLGWIDAETLKFAVDSMDAKLRIPHMGWNRVSFRDGEPLFAGLNNPKFYFVHSYHVVCSNPLDSIGTAFYGYNFTCAVKKNNIYGTQFHPEKSHKYGITLLRSFLRLPNNA